MEKCPDCRKGKLYSRKTADGYETKSCYLCGYYWHNGSGYDHLSRQLFKEYFPREEGWRASPDVGQPFTSPEHWTEPRNEKKRLLTSRSTICY